jgi:hypothetical protein
MEGSNAECNKLSKRARQLYEIGKQQGTITKTLNARSDEWVRERYDKRIRDMIASSRALLSADLFLLEQGPIHKSDRVMIGGNTRAVIIKRYLSCHQYGNGTCMLRAVHPRS